MKRNYTFLMAAFMLLAMFAIPMGMKGQTKAEEVYSTCLFGSSYNSQSVSNYTSTWTATNGDFSWTIVNGNNNQNGWSYVKFGRKNNTSVGSITTTAEYDEAITKVDLTIDALTASSINSIKLYTSTNNSTWTEVGSFNKATGKQTVAISSPATDLYYKIEFDCASGSANGLVTVSKVEYSYSPGGNLSVVTPTFTPDGGSFMDSQEVSINCATEDATIYYTIDGNDPTTSSSVYSAPFTINETTTVKAFAVKDNYDDSEIATATFTKTTPMTVAEAIDAIDAQNTVSNAYVAGIICQVDNYNSNYHSITYWISDDGTTTTKLEVYSGKGLGGANFNSVSDVVVGAEVIVKGTLKKYNDIYEFDKNNELISYTAPTIAVEAPTFSPAAGTYAEAQTVTISCETQGVDIYYTLDGSEPNDESEPYSGSINVSETTTIKAIAYDGNSNASTVATATYHICSQANPYTVAQALDFNEYPANGIYVHGIVSTAPTQSPTNNGELTYYISDDGEATDQLEVYKGKGLEQAAFTAQDDIQLGDIVTIYGNVQVYNSTIEFGTGNYLVEFERPASAEPSVTVTPATIEATYEGADGTLTITYENIPDLISFDYYFCDANGNQLDEDPDWIFAEIDEEDNVYSLSYIIDANDGEARTAYFKVFTTIGDELDPEEVYAIVTVNQTALVVDYAVLPFEWEGGSSADFLALNGTSANGLGSDYAAGNAPYLIKLDTNGDFILVKTDSQPGKVTIEVKMIGGGNTSTITVQGSSDGETFTDIEELTISGNQGDVLTLETINAFDENDRYVKLVFTKGSNVGVGPITIAKPSTEPFITITPDVLDVDAEEHLVNYLNLTYANFVVENTQSFTVHYYNDEDEEIYPGQGEAWMVAGVVKPEDVYQVLCTIIANEGEARSAYFRVSTTNTDKSDIVYSNLVTVNQAAAPQQYTLTVEPFENLELITFVNDEMVMEGDGEIQVTEGDQIMLSIVADENYVMETLMVNGVDHVNDIADDFTYTFEMPAEDVTISATAVEYVAPTPGSWVLTSLEDLTEDDIFVIVGTFGEDSYAMANDNGTSTAPAAVSVTVVDGTLSDEPAANLQWNVSGNDDDGYIFYPNDDTENWLYCTNANNGVRVGTNASNTFKIESGYLQHQGTSRYVGIYLPKPDWRCYTNTTGNIVDQTFAFYKKVETSNTETYTLDIKGYETGSTGGYYLIASPVTVDPATVDGMTDGEFDLFYFDESAEAEWRNYKQEAFNLVPGKGYLYAKEATTEGEIFHFELTGTPYNGEPIILSKAEGGDFPGWNLVGNPYGETAYIDREFYVMKDDGSEIITGEGNEIAPMQGIFVKAAYEGEEMTFSTVQTKAKEQIVLNITNCNTIIDRAIVRFDNNDKLPKMMLNERNTKVYFREKDDDYAVVHGQKNGKLPINFEASRNGDYIINVNVDNMNLSYLHLIDHQMGEEIDLLKNPVYKFEAKTTDEPKRFVLVYKSSVNPQEMASRISRSADFSFYNNDSWFINNEGEAVLQVIDANGRILSNEVINGSCNKHIEAAPGVYMIRLINGNDVKTQKVIVK